MDRLTLSGTKEAKADVTIRQIINKLAEYEDLEEQREQKREKLLEKIREMAFERCGNGDGMGGQLVVSWDDLVDLIKSEGV